MKKKSNNLFPQPNNTSNENAGFSLVELLIAVIILAIIVVPLLHGFVTSARMNGKARQTQRAVTVAQDLMEGLKAYDIEELKAQFNHPENGFYVIESKLIKGSIGEDTDREQNDSVYRGDPDMPGVYYFTLEGVQIQGSEFDALIRIDARNYEQDPTKDVGIAYGHDNAFNGTDLASLGSVMKKDGSYPPQLGKSSLIAANKDNLGFLQAIKDNPAVSPDIAATVTDLEALKNLNLKNLKDMGVTDINRTITLNIRQGLLGADGKYMMDMDISYKYTYRYKGAEYSYYPDGHKPSEPDEIGFPCGSDVSSDGNFYLMYYPLYDAGEVGSPGDKIVINNEAHQPIRIYIVKLAEQDTESQFYLSDAKLDAAENKYRTIIDIKDSTVDNVKIRTNLGMNLVNASFSPGAGSTPAEGKLPTYEIEKADIPQAGYYRNGTLDGNINVFSLSGRRLSGSGTGNDDEITEVIFDVQISVYKKGAKDDGFPDSQRMAYITGSKNN